MLILYHPPSSPQRKPILPLSLLALGGVLEGRYEYRIIDGNLESNPLRALIRAIRGIPNPILAVTVMPGPQLADAVATCRYLKSVFPGLTVIWGGYFPTQHPEVCLESGYVDYVVRGHGELVFGELLDYLAQGETEVQLAGVACKYRDDTLLSQPAEMPDPDQLPDFPYSRLAMDRYPRSTFLGRRTLSHHSSYGCPFLCNFCAVVNLAQGRWLAQSAERVASVAKTLAGEYAADAIEFQDNNFFVSEARIAELSERITPLRLRWWGEARIDTLLKYSDTTWKLMRQAGLKMVFMGAESGSDEVLARMDKGGTACVDKTLQIAEQAARHDIVPEFSFILGNPPDPEADAQTTLEFIRRLKQVNPRSEIILYLYTPVPLAGSLLEAAQDQGFQFPSDLESWVSPEWLKIAERRSPLSWVEARLQRKLRNFERVLNAYYPTSTDVTLTPLKRSLLRLLSGWRYRLRIYAWPLELRLMQRWIRYQRPETSGF